eukprot:m.69672 g.69672  ORF g.69672 m.69672 type:complete len:636 (-) comp12235_c0_seq2:2166-4073(-)
MCIGIASLALTKSTMSGSQAIAAATTDEGAAAPTAVVLPPPSGNTSTQGTTTPSQTLASVTDAPSDYEPEFWRSHGYREVVARINQTETLLQNLRSMINERAKLDRKHAAELRKFNRKWTTKLPKVNVFSTGELERTTRLMCNEATLTSDMFEARAIKMEKGPAASVSKQLDEHYSHSMFSLRIASDLLKGFKTIEKNYVRSKTDASKHKAEYFKKHERNIELQGFLEQARLIQASSSAADEKKLTALIDKTKKEIIVLREKYQKAVEQAQQEFAAYVAAMREQYEVVEAELETRLERVVTIATEYSQCLKSQETVEVDKQLDELATTMAACKVVEDLHGYAQNKGVYVTPPCVQFQEHTSVGEHFGGGIKRAPRAPEGPKMLGAWFTKAGEGSLSLSHKRFFVLRGEQLEYFSSLVHGVPKNSKGSINLDTATDVSLEGSTLQISTPGRCWKLSSKEPGLLKEWYAYLNNAVVRCRSSTYASSVPVAAAAAVATSTAAGASATTPAATSASVVLREPDTVSDIESEPDMDETQKHEAAAVKIQAAYRGHVTRKNLNRQKEAATTIQAAYRGHQVRQQMKRESEAASTIQSGWRQHKQDQKAKSEAVSKGNEGGDLVGLDPLDGDDFEDASEVNV